MGKVVAKPNLLPVWKININGKEYDIFLNAIHFNDLEKFSENNGFNMTDDMEISIGEFICDEKNQIDKNFHIWGGLQNGKPYWIEVECMMIKEDFE